MLGGNNLEREESESSNSGRRPELPSYNALINQNVQSHSNSREAEIRSFAQNGHSLRESDSNSEFIRLSDELNQRVFQEMGEFMSSVSSQIQRAINDQILPQIQATLKSNQGQMPGRRWEIPARRQGFTSEEAIDRRFRSSSRAECNRNFNGNEDLNNTCDNIICLMGLQPATFSLVKVRTFIVPATTFGVVYV